MSKGYGLILPGKEVEKPTTKTNVSTKPSIFNESDSSSDGDNPQIRGKYQLPISGPGAVERRQAKAIQQKALAEDPTIFQYDELYDEIENKRDEQKKVKSSEEKKPKYIKKLLQQAERRKLDNERRIERQVQKEREAEGDEFKDKESFVTSAYKIKLEELKKAEEAEQREEYLEAIGDVTKQGNLDGFYRHLYEQKLGGKNNENFGKKTNLTSNNENSSKVKSRTYRKRHSSEDELDDSNPKKTHIQSNLDADSDFSIDDESSSDENKNENVLIVENKTEINIKIETETEDKEKTLNSPTNEEQIVQPKRVENIWKKRTVGDVLDAALQRYYERKNRNL